MEKNGGGSTEEITRDAGTGLEGFGWRLSIADIGESGGFSTFAGYERVISVLQGSGMTLNVDGQVTRALHPLDPFTFSGESHVFCTLLGGPIRDFNLIYAPQRYRARLQWLGGQQRFFSVTRKRYWCSVPPRDWLSRSVSPPLIWASTTVCN
nr:hypothetical protein GCM10020185_27090 [Pseudomonas brassicacearum subsp. brassicacearum]